MARHKLHTTSFSTLAPPATDLLDYMAEVAELLALQPAAAPSPVLGPTQSWEPFMSLRIWTGAGSLGMECVPSEPKIV